MSGVPPKPARVLWAQLSLRVAAVLVAFTAIIIAIVSSLRLRPIPFFDLVNISLTINALSNNTYQAFVSLIINTAEITALASRYIHKLRDPVPRIHPIILIALDFSTLCLLIWSFFALFLDAWGSHKIVTLNEYNASPFNIVETWFAVAVGIMHALLIVFDFVDCCSVRYSARPEYENQPRERQRAQSRGRDDLFDMDW
ncbi:hypothetical protein BDZ45DRAFT_797411 [Acephala macrosclerotiorum]|nr:hypothetical protein BDZ45DRAFT_797411 [Acephala macrosclerotiorum]